MSIKHTILIDGDEAERLRSKKGNVSIEMKMIIDDGEGSGPFSTMFVLENFRNANYDEIEKTILDNTKHVARCFSLALLNRPDCLNGKS